MSYGLKTDNKDLVFTAHRTQGDVYGLGDNNNVIDLESMGRVVKKGFIYYGTTDFKIIDLRLAMYIKVEPGVELNFRASLHNNGWFTVDHFALRANYLTIDKLPTTPANNSYGLSVNGKYLNVGDLVLQYGAGFKINSSDLYGFQSYLNGKYILVNPFIRHLRDCFERARRGDIPSMSFYLSYKYDRYNRTSLELRYHGLIPAELTLKWLTFEGSNL